MSGAPVIAIDGPSASGKGTLAAAVAQKLGYHLLDSGALFLDEQYRYASDMDLVLRLISSGRRARHIDRYLALFAFDGSNLSCSPAMMRETLDIRHKFGGASSRVGRLPAIAGRIVERIIKRCYRADDLDYPYVISERPDYRHIRANRIPYSYVTQ